MIQLLRTTKEGENVNYCIASLWKFACGKERGSTNAKRTWIFDFLFIYCVVGVWWCFLWCVSEPKNSWSTGTRVPGSAFRRDRSRECHHGV